LPDAGFEQLHLPITGHKRDALPGLIGGNRPQRYGRLFEILREDALIVGNGAVRFEPSLPALIQPVGISYFGEAPAYHLSRQLKAGLHFPVTEPLKRVLPENPPLPRYFRAMIAGGVGALKRIFQDVRLLSRWTELQLGNELHTLEIVRHLRRFPYGVSSARLPFLPSAKAGGFLGAISVIRDACRRVQSPQPRNSVFLSLRFPSSTMRKSLEGLGVLMIITFPCTS
jgi:hypothetical protein